MFFEMRDWVGADGGRGFLFKGAPASAKAAGYHKELKTRRSLFGGGCSGRFRALGQLRSLKGCRKSPPCSNPPRMELQNIRDLHEEPANFRILMI